MLSRGVSWKCSNQAISYFKSFIQYDPRHEETNVLVSDPNQAVQLQKMARSMKSRF